MQELLKYMMPEIEKATEATVEMIQEITQDTVSIKLLGENFIFSAFKYISYEICNLRINKKFELIKKYYNYNGII